MLQQTQVKTVIPYYLRFMQRFPDIPSLAQASEDEVLHYWTGLGYYARARNLQKAAKMILDDLQGQFPESLEDLISLPGIGRSTAGAILSLACGQHHPILDGNVKRILSRYFEIKGWSGTSKTQKELWAMSSEVTPELRCNDFNQAMMDLGSSLCSRSKPRCNECPLVASCRAYLNQTTQHYPNPKPKKQNPTKSAFFLILSTREDEILLEKRSPQGIWGGLWSFPQFDNETMMQQWLAEHDYQAEEKMLLHPEFRHTFSHFHLIIKPVQMTVIQAQQISDNDRFLWYSLKKPLKLGMPTPIHNLISHLSAGKKP
jgi:A/G-specific adenine glycosylase